MSNTLLGFPIHSDVGAVYTPTLSGGSWLAGLPLANLQDRRLHRVARSSSDAIADTLFTLDATANVAVRVMSLVNHNISAAGAVRFRGFTALPVVDSLTMSTGWSHGAGVSVADNNVANWNGVFTGDTVTSAGGVSSENTSIPITFTGDGEKAATLYLKAGTSAQTDVNLRDNTAGTNKHIINIAWSGGVPTVTSQFGSGSILETTLIGDGWYRITFTATGMVAANLNSLLLYATGTGTAAGTVVVDGVFIWNQATSGLVADSGFMFGLPAGTDADSRAGWVPQATYVTDADATGRYWRVNIWDTTNPDTYVEIGRLIIAGGIQPTVNMSHGAQLGWVTSSSRIESDGGAYIHSDRPRRREVRFLLENQSQSEAFGPLWRLMRRAGTTGQLFFVLDPEDTETYLWERSFLGVLRELSPVEFARATYHATPVAVTEEL